MRILTIHCSSSTGGQIPGKAMNITSQVSWGQDFLRNLKINQMDYVYVVLDIVLEEYQIDVKLI